jgi:NAD(P)-dependent dehydrogenase (short-subunit alcohol dehydrogenase family)
VISLAGARALVTGGSRGIGAATARLLAKAGAQVVVGYRSRMADAVQVVEELRAYGVRAEAFGADISTREGRSRSSPRR